MSAQPQSLEPGAVHPAFEFVRHQPIPSLNLEVSEYRHRVTGARHFHFAADDDNNAFLVAFLTVPQDSTGVAHILEHTSLCGSERFPVRDPFFMMIRRSLNTFMNAMTASDWTAYPFASRNRKDFYNLLDVYLDAVFFPRLDRLDFAQEGHRVEFATPDDPDSPLVFKGVVFNEMKGAMSAPTSQLWQEMQTELFPTTTYHHNSGGDPERIPDLSYEQLKAFHARHYHPSNAVFMTYGDLPVDRHHQLFEDKALAGFERLEMDLAVPDERRYPAPRAVDASYALDADQGLSAKTHIVLGWLLGHNTDIDAVLTAKLLTGVLMDNGSCPLLRALETTELGTSPSPLCFLDHSTREMALFCGVEGAEPERADAVEELVLGVLREVAENGIPQQQVESILHQFELHQREVSGGHTPYGLSLMLNGLATTLHGGDPVAMLDIDRQLAELRERIRDPGYIKSLVCNLLLDNPHRVRLTMSPDPQLNARLLEAEKERLAAIKAAMDSQRKAEIIELSKALEQRQMRADDPEMLPKVGIEDVQAELHIATGERVEVASMEADWYAQGTNGMVYQQVAVDLPALDPDQQQALSLLGDFIGEVGIGDDYIATQARIAATTGGVGGRYSLRSGVDDLDGGHALWVVSGKALARNHRALAELVRGALLESRFDELSRIRELVAQDRAGREAGVTGHGHALAMTAATAGFNRVGRFNHESGGLVGLQRLKALDQSLKQDAELEAFAARLADLALTIAAAPRRLLLVGEQSQRDAVLAGIEQVWGDTAVPSGQTGGFAPATGTGRVLEGWATNSQVRFCAKAYPTVPINHPDAPALKVLGGFLRNGYLHRTVREQGGAYGGGAGYDGDTGGFRFYSYRDPRLTGTLDDFDQSIRWLAQTDHPSRALEEAILGVIGAIDKPGTPAGEAVSAYFSARHGRTAEQRREFRKRVLAVSLDDLKRVGETYLRPERASIAVVGDADTLSREGQALGLTIHEL